MVLYLGKEKITPTQNKSKGGIIPVGTLDIIENGLYNVTNYARANVQISGENANLYEANLILAGVVEGLPQPTESDVVDEALLILKRVTSIDNSEEGVRPKGTLNITENGIYNVINYAYANVNVEQEGGTDTFEANLVINGVVEGLPQPTKNELINQLDLILKRI